MSPEHFKPMSGKPVLQFTGRAEKYHKDYQRIGNVWILSSPVREFFERIDPGAFEFRECLTVYPDGSPGPARSAAVVSRMIDALDTEKSETTPNEYDKGGGTLGLSQNKKNYFKKSIVGSFDFFTVPQAGGVFVSQRVKDEFKQNEWSGASFSKAFLI